MQLRQKSQTSHANIHIGGSTSRTTRRDENKINLYRALCCIIVSVGLATHLSGCVSNDSKSEEGGEALATGSDLDLDSVAPSDSASGDAVVDEDLSDSGVDAKSASQNKDASGGSAPDLTLDQPEPPASDEPKSQTAADLGKDNNSGSGAGSDSGFNSPPNSSSGDSAAQEVNITDIRYVSKKGGGTVVIDTSGPATYRTREVPDQNQVVVEIANAKLPERLKHPYITKEFRQSIDAISAYQNAGSTTARVVIQFNQPTRAAVAQSGKTLTVVASATGEDSGSGAVAGEAGAANESSSEISSMASGGGPITKTQSGEAGVNKSDAANEIVRNEMSASSLEGGNADEMHFYGKPISLEFSDTPTRDVIAMIAEQSGANILIGGAIDGNISLKLKQIPWDQALLLVMKTKGLGYVRQGSVLRIAPIADLQKETDELKRISDAQKAAEPLRVKVIPVSYAKVTELAPQLANFLSARGKASGDIRTSSVVVTDIPENLERVANLVKSLDTPPLQVLIEAKVVEANEQFSRGFGINWGYTGNPTGSNIQFSHDLNITPGLPKSTSGQVDLHLGTLDILGDLTASLAIAESESLARVVSSPRILAMNNEIATIVQKTSIPIHENRLDQGRVVGQTTTYKDVPLILEVTPQITANSDILMQIHLQRDFVSGEVSEPSIESRDAKTKVSVQNGQTAVIGGIYQSDTQESEVGIPYLRNIPIIGWLFKQKNSGRQKNELLLFLTPRILKTETKAEKAVAKGGHP